MAPIPQPYLLARLWEYASSIGIYWWSALAVLSALERYSDRLIPETLKPLVDKYLSPTVRRRLFLIFIAVAFLIANFRAFDEERQAREETIARVARIEGIGSSAQRDAIEDLQRRLAQTQSALETLAHPKTPLSIDDADARNQMIAFLKAAGPHLFRIDLITRDNATSKLAQNIYNAFILAGWNPDAPSPVPVGYPGVSGVMISGRTANNNPSILTALKIAFHSVGLDAEVDGAGNSFVAGDGIVEIFVSR